MTKKTKKIIRYPLFADTFTNWMIQRNFTQKKLSRRLEVNQSVISRFCTGDRLPSLAVFLRLIGICATNERSQFITILNQQLQTGDKCEKFLKIQ